MIRITQMKLRPDAGRRAMEEEIRRLLRLREGDEYHYEIRRQAVDARKKPDIFYVYTVLVILKDPERERKILQRYKNGNISEFTEESYRIPAADGGLLPDAAESGPGGGLRPVVVGSGPAGLFCALALARAGLRPIVIERGGNMEERTASVQRFWDSGQLDPRSNVQFGEGGAGTFSDGKLNTGVKDPHGRIRFVLETFAQAGADPDILYSYKPHIGTDVLAGTITHIRDEIIGRGGEFHFNTCLRDLHRQADGTWTLELEQMDEKPDPGQNLSYMQAQTVVLAIGHSSRDTFFMLHREGFSMSPKAFAVGFRVQHPQKMINDALYGAGCRYAMPPSPYRLTHRLADGRGVYSFCMCPGGYVVNASSEEGMLAVNGMSYHGRASENANSAIVVTVSPEQIRGYLESPWAEGPSGIMGKDPVQADPLFSGVLFQRQLERYAFLAGDGGIPVQRFEDYCMGHPSEKLGSIQPVMKGKFALSDVRSILPPSIGDAVEEGMKAFDRQIRGFSCPDVLLAGVESRTSSPVRIERREDLQSVTGPGIYPCGEGAGYAGGITSAAVDGLKAAEAILAAARHI